MGKYSILLVEDSIDIVEVVSLHLTNAGYEVTAVSNYSEVLLAVDNQKYDLIVLDIMLPDSTGYDLCLQIRKSTYCPIIFMSCLDSEEHITRALELGGDDYITKPARPKEIVARIKANLRRVEDYSKLQKKLGNDIEFGGLVLNKDEYQISSSKDSFKLTPLELMILTHLLEHEGELVSYQKLYEDIWESQAFDDYRTVRVHVSNLNIKLRKLNAYRNLIMNIRGQGYILKLP